MDAQRKLLTELIAFNERDNKLLDSGKVPEKLIAHMVQGIETRKVVIATLHKELELAEANREDK